jgi:hypothetical protein
LLAGCGGALGANLMWKLLQLIKLNSLKKKHSANNYLNIGREFEKESILSNQVKRTYFLDLGISYDVFVLLRGIIAGAVSVTISPSGYTPWTAVINGIISGIIYQIATKISHLLKIDDTMHICQVHGASSLYSLFSICIFHKTQGFFFNDVFLRSYNFVGTE